MHFTFSNCVFLCQFSVIAERVRDEAGERGRPLEKREWSPGAPGERSQLRSHRGRGARGHQHATAADHHAALPVILMCGIVVG